MPDLLNRLNALHGDTALVTDDGVIESDLRRGHAALITRRRRRAGMAGVATLGIVAAGSLSYSLTTGDNVHTPQAVAPHTTVVTHAPNTSAPTSAVLAPALKLVAYQDKQLPGYTVRKVPAGYVLQGISDSVLDVAKKGDTSALDTFTGKLVVTLDDHPGPKTGQPVTVNGRPGRIDDQDGVLILTYNDGTHDVDVQSWSNIHISRDQLVQFAEGVTVLPGAQVSHG